MGYFCDFKTLITVLKSTHNNVKLVPLESVDRDESNGTNFRYQLEKMSQQVKKIFRFAIKLSCYTEKYLPYQRVQCSSGSSYLLLSL